MKVRILTKSRSRSPLNDSVFQFFVGFSILAITSATISSSSSEEDNAQKIRRVTSKTVVAVEIPDKSLVEMSFPNLKFVNDSSELHNEDDRIAENGTMISGVAVRFGKRSIRAYPSSSHSQMMMMTGGGHPYNTRGYNRPGRYDNRRNSLDSADGSSSSSSWGGKWFNQLRRRTSMMMSPMVSYDRQQQIYQQNQGTAEEPEMAATFLGGGGGGWGQPSHYGKGTVNKSAVGLLGFLSLLSLIQNVLNQTSTMPMQMQGRRRRDVRGVSNKDDEDFQFGDDWDEAVAESALLTPYLLPMLNAVTQAQRGQITVECTLQPICLANKALVEKLGKELGKVVGQTVSDALSKTLKRAGWRWKTRDWDIGGQVTRAGKSGRNGKQCSDLYKDCRQLARMAQYSSPNNFNY